MEDQAQIEGENQVYERETGRAAAAQSQITLISGISVADRTKIARKKEISMILATNTKKAKAEAITKKKRKGSRCAGRTQQEAEK